MDLKRIIQGAGVIFALIGAGFWLFTNFWFGLSIFFVLFGGFILQGLRRVPADPPHMAQVTIFGERFTKTVTVRNPHTGEDEEKEVSVYKEEGWRFFPLCPIWYGLILIKVERLPFDVVSELTKTPDNADSRVPVLVAGRPSPDHFIQYLNSGGVRGVTIQLRTKILERLREWSMSLEEGPFTWRELNMSQLEGTSVLIKNIAGNSLTIVPPYAQDVPTWIWLRYFRRPRPTQFLERENDWAEDDWKRVKDRLSIIKSEEGPEALLELQEKVEKRRREIRDLRTGDGKILVEDIGWIIERLNIGDIDLLGGAAEAADAQAREKLERDAEEVELAHVRARIKEFMGEPFNYSPEQALEAVQTERGKVPKVIDEKKLSIAPESRDVVERVLTAFARR